MPVMTATTVTRRRSWFRFALHYVGWSSPCFVGMFALAPHCGRHGLPGRRRDGDGHQHAIGMGVWMKIRRHSWRHIVEMSAAMYLPFVALLVPYWLGVVSGHG